MLYQLSYASESMSYVRNLVLRIVHDGGFFGYVNRELPEFQARRSHPRELAPEYANNVSASPRSLTCPMISSMARSGTARFGGLGAE